MGLRAGQPIAPIPAELRDRKRHLRDKELYRLFYTRDEHPGVIYAPKPDEPRVRWTLENLLPTDDVIDIGCHKGELTLYARRATKGRVVGVDISANAIREASGYAAHHRLEIEYTEAEAESLPYVDSSFDAAILTEILEHVVDPFVVLAEAERVVRPGGRIIISTPRDAVELDHQEAAERDRKLHLALDRHVREFDPARELIGKPNLKTERYEVEKDMGYRIFTFKFYCAVYTTPLR